MLPSNNGASWVQNPEHVMFLQLVSSGAFEAVRQITVHKPELVNTKGWNGFTALHRACLCGNFEIAHILLQAGADPNATSDANETPMHYACKRGIPRIVCLLSQFGGNAKLLDNQGRTGMHHAADMGSVYMFHYLSLVEGLEFRELDNKLQAPIHITASYGHLDAFKYLLRHDRSDLTQRDSEGNTPVHITARQGFGHMTYTLVSLMSCRALHVRNDAGYTPLDLAMQNDKPGHRELQPVLKRLTEMPDHNHRPKGPYWQWYYLLFCPGLIYSLGIFAAEMMNDTYESVGTITVLLYLLTVMMKQQHRLNDVSRWPNPFYAGMFGAGLIHTLMVFYVKIWPHVIVYSFYFFMTPIFSVLLLAVYIKTLLMDPGVVPIDNEAFNPKLIQETFQVEKKMESFCISCEILRPVRTKHCKLCNQCFRSMDHHCLFLLKCVAQRNHRFFVLLILITECCILLYLSSVVTFCILRYSSHTTVWTVVGAMLNEEGWITSMTMLNMGCTFWGLSLLVYQLRVVANGHTSFFTPKFKGNALSSLEKLMNVLHFFMGRKPFLAHPMLEEHV